MSKPTKENLATVLNGLKEFSEQMEKTQCFPPTELVNFVESKFEAAGYREKSTLG